MSSSDTDRVVSVTLTHVALALQPVLYYTVTPRTHALALALPCPPSTSQSHVHVRARHEPCGRRAGDDDERLGVALACTKRRCAVRVSASQGRMSCSLQACSPACYQAYRARTRSSLCRREQKSTSAARAVFFCICMTLPKRHDGSCAGLLARGVSDKPIQKNGTVQCPDTDTN